MIVCINKMDEKTVKYNVERYDEIKSEVSQYLRRVGYQPSKIPFIPISGFTGEGLLTVEGNLEWYKGVPLIEALA